MTNEKVALYARFSSAKQEDGYSIEAQVGIGSEYCEKHGYEIVRIYEERAYSGTNFHRPQFQQLMQDAASGLFTAVVFHKVDRFGRASCEALNYAEKLRQLGIRLLFIYEGLDTSNDKDYCEFVRKIADAEYYSRNLASEAMKALSIRANEGLYNGGNVSLGFQIDSGGYYVRDPLTAPIVERIFKMYLDDIPVSQIAERLNAEGFRTATGNPFNKNNLYAILHNERYAGVYTYNKSTGKDRLTGKRNTHKQKTDYVRLPGMCDTIIPPEQFALVQAKMAANNKAPGSYTAKHDYHYNGLIYSECGHGMYSHSNHSKGRVYTQYQAVCDCGCKRINLQQLDYKIAYLLGEILFSENNQEGLLKALNAYSEQQLPACSQRYLLLDAERNDLTERQRKLISVIEHTESTHIEGLTARLSEIEQRLTEINTLIGSEPPTIANHYTAADIPLLKHQFRQAFCNDKQMPEKTAFIRRIIKSITVDNEVVIVNFHGGMTLEPEVKKALLQ